MRIILILTLAFILSSFCGCTDERTARRVLESQGYTNIRFTGYDFFSCSEEDNFHTGFEATTPAGKPVSGCVCSGLLKAATVRFK